MRLAVSTVFGLLKRQNAASKRIRQQLGRNLRTVSPAVSTQPLTALERETDKEIVNPRDILTTNAVVRLANEKIEQQCTGRLFAVIYFSGKQFKVTTGDIIMLEENHSFSVGDVINIEKVLMVGSADFSMFGRPLLPKGSVNIEATIIEKTLSFAEPDFFSVPKKDVRFLKFLQKPINMIRINSIDIVESLPDMV